MTISPGSQATSSAGPPIKSRRRDPPRIRPTLLRFPGQKQGTSRLRPGIRGPRPLLPCLVAMHSPRLRKPRRMTAVAPGLQPPLPATRPQGRMRRRSSSLTTGLRPSMVPTHRQARVRPPAIRVSSSPARGMAPVLSRASSDNTDSQASSGRTASPVRMPARAPRVASPPARVPSCLSDPAAPTTAGPVLAITPAAA